LPSKSDCGDENDPMAKRLQHDMNTDPNYFGWFAGMIAVLAVAGFMFWALSANSNVASDRSAAPATTGSTPSRDAPKVPASPVK
jgi:hypothetical protein